MENQKVSVVIPVYNGEKTLESCLVSLLNQTHPNYEIVVVDNNSIDNTKKIIKKYQDKDKEVKYIFEGYRSRGAARNAGIVAASGQIIAMIDADCIADSDWLDKITEPIIRRTENIVVANQLIVGTGFWSEQRMRQIQEFMSKRTTGNYVRYFNSKSCAIKKDLIINIGMFNPLLKNCEDADMGIKLLLQNLKVFYLKECFVRHKHKLSLFGWINLIIDRAFWLDKCFEINKDKIGKLSYPSYEKMGHREFFIFFLSSSLSLLFGKHKQNIIFDIITGIAYRIGVIKSKLLF